MMQLAAFLCVICVICGRIHARVLKLSARRNPNVLSQITLIIADKTQNNNIPICLSLRYNATCCIPLRHLRDLRENTHARVLNLYCTNEPPTVAQQPFYESKKLFYSFTQHKSNFKVNYLQ